MCSVHPSSMRGRSQRCFIAGSKDSQLELKTGCRNLLLEGQQSRRPRQRLAEIIATSSRSSSLHSLTSTARTLKGGLMRGNTQVLLSIQRVQTFNVKMKFLRTWKGVSTFSQSGHLIEALVMALIHIRRAHCCHQSTLAPSLLLY